MMNGKEGKKVAERRELRFEIIVAIGACDAVHRATRVVERGVHWQGGGHGQVWLWLVGRRRRLSRVGGRACRRFSDDTLTVTGT